MILGVTNLVEAMFLLLLTTALLDSHAHALIHSKSISTGTSAAGNETDFGALMAFKSMILQDPRGVLSSWNISLHFCQWEGVTCHQRYKRVTFLNLSSKGLVGSLSPQIGNMSFLQKLWLDNNTLTGIIPPEVGHLFRLQDLRLSNNFLQGEIPISISNCSNLYYLNVYGNELVGRIPRELSLLSKLKNLWLHVNNLTGEIPPSVGNLTSLESLAATYNFLTGALPDSLGQLRNLRDLSLGVNQFVGVIPPSVYNLSLLTIFSLPSNQLQGSLPPDLGLMLPHLQYLQLGNNQITGPLPWSLANASQLGRIDMTYNNLTGKINIDFGRLQNLTGISLGANTLGSGDFDEMSFLASLSNCSNLQVLELSFNQLKGTLPQKVQNFSRQFFYLSLRTNHIYGNIPAWLSDVVGLTQLLLDTNELTGTIPSAIGNLHNLQRFTLDTNQLSGQLPASLGNLSLVSELTLSNNELQGILPPSLGDCQNLILLDLSQNSFNGIIPKRLFGISKLTKSLNLSHNRFFGSLPEEVGKLIHLSELDVSKNDLSSELPKSIGSCISLVNLYLQGNTFQGPIPSSLSSLKGLQKLDLSRNNFSGHVPDYLEGFSLTYLNLSFNDLDGEIPTKGPFANSSVVSVVGNSNLCGGILELQLPRCAISQPNRRKATNYRLILIIIIPSVLIGVIVFLYSIYCTRSSNSSPIEPFFRVSYEMLLKATDGFSSTNLVGAGSFGFVYKGIIEPNQEVVAVKVLNLSNRGALRSFMAECEALRNIRHRNLVKVVTSCSSIDFQGNEFKALVYEFMPNGNVDTWVHHNIAEPRVLNLEQRLSIAIDVACALDYLHNHCERPIIHCDLKPSNILLDTEMVAHVGDFGLSRFLLHEPLDGNQSSSIGIKGTIGYTPPEYGMGAEVSEKGDVYSYGILLLEIISGKIPTDPIFGQDLNLHNYANARLPDRVMEVVDPILVNDNGDEIDEASSDRRHECLISMVKLGVGCSMESPHDRMNISNVLRELYSVRRIFQSNA